MSSNLHFCQVLKSSPSCSGYRAKEESRFISIMKSTNRYFNISQQGVTNHHYSSSSFSGPRTWMLLDEVHFNSTCGLTWPFFWRINSSCFLPLRENLLQFLLSLKCSIVLCVSFHLSNSWHSLGYFYLFTSSFFQFFIGHLILTISKEGKLSSSPFSQKEMNLHFGNWQQLYIAERQTLRGFCRSL